MPIRRNVITGACLLATACSLAVSYAYVQAAANDEIEIDDASVVAEINQLKDEIDSKRDNADALQDRIKAYQTQIDQQQSKTATLKDETSLIENRIAKTELSLQATEEEMAAVDAEIRLLNAQISALEAQLDRQRRLLGQLLQSINTQDEYILLEAFFSGKSFSDIFDQLQYLKNVNAELGATLEKAKASEGAVTRSRTELDGRRTRLADLQSSLSSSKLRLEDERGAKDALLAQSQASEAQFRSLLSQSREEEAYINQQISLLQGQIEAKLADIDGVVGPTVLSWPVDPAYRGISTLFHDPTYPFRHLFEHSGIDVPQKQGSPVGAAAPGYVAWTRVGSQYGNYVMVIHTNGIATLYAHLSKVMVKADQFVDRGQTIALSGGTPGTAGAGLSTGAHLHFEVRKDGIPVDPLNFLVKR